ncbi:MAG TPA: hypothetical protein EYP90_09635 [Chromatiaceae bacterium]|nr:hypothetical protein [Chromatiaceae bacterium]HIP72770.1 hypothetical protein [Anaerolineae bacterium]
MNINYGLIKRSVLFIIGLLLLVSCTATSSRPKIDPAKLLINLADMPADWYIVSQGDLPDNYRQQGGADIEFNVNNPQVLYVAAHRVYEYKNERQAAREFEKQLPHRFNSNSIASRTPWRPPQELPYISTVAEQFYFACHEGSINRISTICQAMGQYENYLVIFHTHVTPEYMTYADIESILLIIDARMAEYLANDNE